MTDDHHGWPYDHLFARPVQESMGGAEYGAWRAIANADAAALSFGFPFPDSFPRDELLAATEAVLEEEGAKALQYGGSESADRLVEWTTDHARERGMDATEDEILLTNGGSHGLDLVCRAFLDPGDRIVVEGPTFMGALRQFDKFDVAVESIPLDDDGLDVDALEGRLEALEDEDEDPPKLLYTIPNFQNPTGVTLTRDRRERLLDLAAEHDFMIVEDDAYGDLRYDGEPVAPLRALDEERPEGGRVIHLGTFSKLIAPGVRAGWAVADETVRDQLRRLNSGGSNTTFMRSVLGKYVDDGTLDATIPELCQAYEQRRDRMLDALEEHMPPAAEWSEPDGGFFVWLELPEQIDADDILDDAIDEGATYLPGRWFYGDDRGANCMRLSYSYEELDEMEHGIEGLSRAIREAI
jgi:2-aminoadipate transaminase